MKTKLLFLALVILSVCQSTFGQLKLRSDNYLQIGADVYTPIMIGPGQNGKWAIEYWQDYGGLNFWIPSPNPSQTDGNGKLFLQDYTGYVGLGTYTPKTRLDVNGNIQISNSSIPMGLMTEVGGTTPLLNFDINFRESNKNYSYLGGAFRIDARSVTSSPLFQWWGRQAGSYSENMLMEMNIYGQLGIGRHPSCALDVTGTIKSNGITVSSDARLKNNIKDMKGSLSSLTRLRGVTYNLKLLNADDSSKPSKSQAKTDSTAIGPSGPHGIDSIFYSRNHIGFLAQEIQQVFPELVYADKDGLLSVDYISVIPILVEAIKELNNKKEIESLNFEKTISLLNERIIADSLYFESKIKTLVNQLNQCCGKVKLRSASIDNNEESTKSTEVSVLSQNSPNPFNQSTTIAYFVPLNVGKAIIYVYNMQGSQIKSIPVTEFGNGKVIINGNELTPGMYIYSLIVDGQEIDTKRMILTE